MSHHRTAQSQPPPPVPVHGQAAHVPPVGTYVPPHEEHIVPLRHSATEPPPNIATNPAMNAPPVRTYVPPHEEHMVPLRHYTTEPPPHIATNMAMNAPPGPPPVQGHPHSPDHAHSHGHQPHSPDRAHGHPHSPSDRAHRPPSGHAQSSGDSPIRYSRHKDIPFPIPHTPGDPALSTKPPPMKAERKRDAKDGGLQDHAELALEGVAKVLKVLDA